MLTPLMHEEKIQETREQAAEIGKLLSIFDVLLVAISAFDSFLNVTIIIALFLLEQNLLLFWISLMIFLCSHIIYITIFLYYTVTYRSIHWFLKIQWTATATILSPMINLVLFLHKHDKYKDKISKFLFGCCNLSMDKSSMKYLPNSGYFAQIFAQSLPQVK